MNFKTKPIAWTIAASDSGGGAGIQADLKTFFDLGVHGCSAITAITAQNTQGVYAVDVTYADSLQQQLRALVVDLPPAAIKIGVLPSVEAVAIVIETLKKLGHCSVIFDTVMAPTFGQAFSSDDLLPIFFELLPYIDILTPNIPEAEKLTGIRIDDCESRQRAAKKLCSMGATAVLLKGGHGEGDYCQDLYLSTDDTFWLSQQKHQTHHTHGTGCTLSSAMAAFIAQGKSMRDAVVLANAYVNKGIRLAPPLAKQKRGAVVQTAWPDDLSAFPQISLTAKEINLAPMPVCESRRWGLYPVVDSVEWLEKLLRLGVKTLQIRVKDMPESALEDIIKKAVELEHQYQARLFINDYWQLAIKYKAYGVHLGQEDVADADMEAIRVAGLRLGISTHGEYEFSYAATFKPSYLAIGAIFPTDTKEVIEVGLSNLYRWAGILDNHYPLVAIGGINQNNIDSVLASGVGAIAVVSAITKADDYIASTAQLNQIISRYS
ncbi:hypothetical protein AB835_09900 [Candidatus Endobugula sertula]|uniref:Thiamine-phosphate synthase n=1 Tax=Candidatus Endobugula sertula TaxID=62101 RepID=A0A1D2QNV1_9GAMM|nr:hypothetical protein AB835_09900 [Candidatus Endobugula sertula]